MIFKLNIEGNELYFTKKSNGRYSKTLKKNLPSKPIIYKETGKYSDNYEKLNKIFTDFYFVYQNVDNIDVHFQLNIFAYKIMIFHGDVEVTNSYNEKHIIQGVYTSITMYKTDKERYKFSNFFMFRDKYSPLDLQACYLFSHCFSKDIYYERNKWIMGRECLNFSHICLGTAEINKVMKRSFKIFKNLDLLNLFIHIDSFIRWESIEGIPYIHLKKVYRNLGKLPKNLDIKTLNIKNILSLIVRQKELKYYLHNNTIKVDTYSFLNVINNLNILEKNSDRAGFILSEEEINLLYKYKAQKISSNVYFNNKYVDIECTEFDRSLYEKCIASNFNRINNSIKDMIHNKLNDILKYYKEEQEYEIIK